MSERDKLKKNLSRLYNRMHKGNKRDFEWSKVVFDALNTINYLEAYEGRFVSAKDTKLIDGDIEGDGVIINEGSKSYFMIPLN